MIILTFLLCLTIPLEIFAANNLKTELSGNLDTQVKQLKNPESAKNLGENWTDENLYLIYTNISAKFFIRKYSKLEVNWFARYGTSQIFNQNYQAPAYTLYPNDVITRDVFKLETTDLTSTNRLDSTLNKFTYEWGDDESKIKIGRMWVQYGNGIIFNPINPFNYPLMFTSLQNIHQGNDGIKFFFNTDPKLRLYLYLFGDKALTNDNGQISRTIFLRGDWQYSNRITINYILGEDQRRHKYGFELNYGLTDGALIAQIVRNTKRIDKDNSSGLTQYIVAFEKDISDYWVFRLEAGNNPQDKLTGGDLYSGYLPAQESFVGAITTVQMSDLMRLSLNLTTDIKTNFSYLHMDVAHQYNEKLQFHVFFSSPLSKNESKSQDEQQTAQLLLPIELGLGIRSVF